MQCVLQKIFGRGIYTSRAVAKSDDNVVEYRTDTATHALSATIPTDMRKTDVTEANEQNTPDKAENTESVKDRFKRTLRECADGITSVRTEVYTTLWWQLIINFTLGAGAIAMLIVSMVKSGSVATGCAIGGIVTIVVLVLFNYIQHSIIPASFLQYTYIDKEKNRRVCYQILSKSRAVFGDGEHVIENNRNSAAMLDALPYAQFGYDYFVNMDPYERIGDADRETYKGMLDFGGKRYKCSVVIKGGRPLYGYVGGCRIKFFDINNTKEKFVVPYTLKLAAKQLNVPFPKTPGLFVRDDVKDLTKQ